MSKTTKHKTIWQPQHLQTAADMAARVARPAASRPALSCVRIRAEGDIVTATASDGEHEITVTCSAETEHPGTIAVDATKLAAIAKQCRESVTMSETKSGVEIRSGGYRWSLQTIDPATCPPAAHLHDSARSLFRQSEAHRLMAGLVRFTDSESSRYAIAGIAIDTESLIATDGRRLTHRIGLGAAANNGGIVIVPSATVALAGRLFAQDGSVDIYTDSNKITYHGLFAQLTGRLLEGRYPKWADVIPDYAKLPRAMVNVAALTAALRGSQVTTTAESRAVTLRFVPNDESLTITSESADIGESDVTCALVSCDIDGVLAIDPQYLLDVLELVPDDDNVELFTDCKNSPLVVRHETNTITAVVMPMATE